MHIFPYRKIAYEKKHKERFPIEIQKQQKIFQNIWLLYLYLKNHDNNKL